MASLAAHARTREARHMAHPVIEHAIACAALAAMLATLIVVLAAITANPAPGSGETPRPEPLPRSEQS